MRHVASTCAGWFIGWGGLCTLQVPAPCMRAHDTSGLFPVQRTCVAGCNSDPGPGSCHLTNAGDGQFTEATFLQSTMRDERIEFSGPPVKFWEFSVPALQPLEQIVMPPALLQGYL